MHVLNLLDELREYMEADAVQREVHERVAGLQAPDTLIAWQCREAYTAGRRARAEDVRDPALPLIHTDRGGSVTFHGPGQLIVYPVVKVRPGTDVVAFVRAMEAGVIEALASFGIEGHTVEGRSGVWCGGNKICAIGMKFARQTTMHGLALNVTTDLAKFERIVPCGIRAAGVTSLERLGVEATVGEVAAGLMPELERSLARFQLRTEDE